MEAVVGNVRSSVTVKCRCALGSIAIFRPQGDSTTGQRHGAEITWPKLDMLPPAACCLDLMSNCTLSQQVMNRFSSRSLCFDNLDHGGRWGISGGGNESTA